MAYELTDRDYRTLIANKCSSLATWMTTGWTGNRPMREDVERLANDLLVLAQGIEPMPPAAPEVQSGSGQAIGTLGGIASGPAVSALGNMFKRIDQH